VDPAVLGQIVFSALNQLFIEFVKDEAMPLARLHALSAAQTANLAGLMATADARAS
jgi:hypothetical protein